LVRRDTAARSWSDDEMSVPVLSGRPQNPKTTKEKAKRQQRQELAEAIPPELLLRRDSSIRYERNGPVYATDGKVGLLKKVVVDEAASEIVELLIEVDGSNRIATIPPDMVDKSAGSALFLTINRVQFAERAASSPDYVKSHFAKADIKSLLKRDGRAGHPKRAVAGVGTDYVETPTSSPLDRISRKPGAAIAS
jgi:hypothetical protein